MLLGKKAFLIGILILGIYPLMFFGCQNNASRKLYIIRHAEKLSSGDDPELSQEGKLRADRIANLWSSRPIKAIYSTPTVRTRSTVGPLSSILELPITEYDVQNHDGLVNLIQSGSGDAVVVGHSNSIYQVANYFQDPDSLFNELDPSDYDTFFEVDIEKNEVARRRFSELPSF
nr:histidine phosphatase family protein [Cytophagales bacterium]